MPRLPSQLRRRIQAQVAVFLLVVAAILAALWAISMFQSIEIRRFIVVGMPPEQRAPCDQWCIGSRSGRMLFYYAGDHQVRARREARVVVWTVEKQPTGDGFQNHRAPAVLQAVGIDWWYSFYSMFYLTIPYWLLMSVFGAGGWLLGRSTRRERRRVRLGLCPACGYDVSMTPWRCPECGYTASASA